MQKAKNRNESKKPLSTNSKQHNLRENKGKTKRQWRLHRKAKQSTQLTNPIYSIAIDNKQVMEIEPVDALTILKDIYPDNKSELKNLSIKKETPEFVLDAMFERLIKTYPKYTLSVEEHEKWYIKQSYTFEMEFHVLPIDELIRCCDNSWSYIEVLIYTIRLLYQRCDIRYDDMSEYEIENLIDYYHSEEDREEKRKTAKIIYELKYGWRRYVLDTINQSDIAVKNYADKLFALTPKTYRQKYLSDFFYEAYQLICRGDNLDEYQQFCDGDEGVYLNEMIRFVWSINNDSINQLEQLTDMANNSGCSSPVFKNLITKESKEVIVPQNFLDFIRLMDYDRINRINR